MQRLIVTGGAGFIGSNLIRKLLLRGCDVLNVDNLTYAGNLDSLEDVALHPNYTFLKANICDEQMMIEAFEDFRPDGVMHLAAESHVDRSIDGPVVFLKTNVLGTFSLLQAARRYWEKRKRDSENFRFLHVSTDEVFGSLGPEGLFNETSSYDPHSPYSASKASSDHLARAWCDTYGLPVIVTNCSNNYGPYQFPEKLIPVVILKALRGDAIPIYGSGENIRDWLYVDDHVEALCRVINEGAVGETYNIGGNNELKNIDLVRLVCRILDELRPLENPSTSYSDLITFVEDRPGHDFRYAIDSTKIRKTLGWEPKQDQQSGIRKTVLWYLENESWLTAILDGSYRMDRIGIAGSEDPT